MNESVQTGSRPKMNRYPAYLVTHGNHMIVMSRSVPGVALWDYYPTGNQAWDDSELRYASSWTTIPYDEYRAAADKILTRSPDGVE